MRERLLEMYVQHTESLEQLWNSSRFTGDCWITGLSVGPMFPFVADQ